ncbi:aldehyde dehydrogenase family protein [Paenarthrobacter nitroguajacolicus]|uniref:aldehyde dehydrogenase family protein n=1 Tax=Paenarthrobacter nitroguajacolicus TaxID=211146 RepID=UPI000AD4C686|nr:aldehyde dehydrogenase family protein [Paenarthrobacter nitroguajacolicus]
MSKTPTLPDFGMMINGVRLQAADQATLPVFAPASGDHIGDVPSGGAKDVDQAVAAARHQFENGEWSRLDGAQRGALLWELARLIEADAENLAALEALDIGRPVAEPLFAEIPVAIQTYRHFAGWADKLTGHSFSLPAVAGQDRLSYTLRQPLGVIGAILPWNAPTMIASWKIAPALAAGNTLVIKPAEDASLPILRLAELIAEAGFPPGVVNVVTGSGPLVGNAIVEHPDIDKISFTGSTAVGRAIAGKAAVALKRVTLELGGKSPQIVWPDANLDEVVPVAALATFANQGQICAAGSRIFVHTSIFEEFRDRLRDHAKQIVVGDPSDIGTQMGSLINQKQFDRVMSHINQGLEDGAQLVTGGHSIDRPGFFVAPTVFVGTNDLPLAREEIFGPVATLIPFDSDDEVLRMANDNEYGLLAVVWTNDVSRISRFAKELKAGSVWANAWGAPHPAVPWLGVKSSGIGEELGLEGLHADTKVKTVHIVSTERK